MTFDVRNDRRDAAILEALRWQAEQAPDLAPSLDEAVRAVARRLGGEAARRTDTRRTWVLLAAAVMLVTLLVGTLAIGAGIIRPPWLTDEPPGPNLDVQPPAFGFAGACRATLGEGLLLELSTPGGARLALHGDGTLISVDPATEEALAFHSFAATITERRMTERGIELLQDAISEAGLSAGCRDLYGTDEVQLRAATDSGQVVVSIGTFPGAYGAGPNVIRVLPPAEEERIGELVDLLADPAAWLPEDAWADEGPREVLPDAWEVSAAWNDSGQSPGDVIEGPSGKVLNGANPEFAAIRLPNGEPIDGEACMVATLAETQELAEAVEAASHMRDVVWWVFSEDLTREYMISATAIVPGEEPCVTPVSPQPAPEAAPHPTDACDLMVAAAPEAVLGGPVEQRAGPPVSLIGTPAPVCTIQTEARLSAYRRVVAAVLRPHLSADEAATAASGILGVGVTEEPLAGGDARLWLSACWSRDCPPALVGWSNGRLFLLTFDRDFMGGESSVSLEEARALAAAIAAAAAAGER